MNSITLNGTSSTTITGLIIQSLPPISKPMIRTQVEEIDGRDGDIVTKLGYAAYDKEISIGLHGSFNIDEVIAFFDSDGIVTFSNEPDKYYKYRITAQADFDRLLRFRQATVTFHVQPFKYSTTEQPVVETITTQESVTVTNSGNTLSKPIITIEGSGVINLSLNGNQQLIISLDTDDSITIDVSRLEAYTDDVLRNRIVVGDYDNMSLDPGVNIISWAGTVTGIRIENYSRWI